jgi:hypothetical protein
MDESKTSIPTDNTIDPFVLYARSLHQYTLGLWTETRRMAEERCHEERCREERRRAQQLEESMASSPEEDQTRKKSSSLPDLPSSTGSKHQT